MKKETNVILQIIKNIFIKFRLILSKSVDLTEFTEKVKKWEGKASHFRYVLGFNLHYGYLVNRNRSAQILSKGKFLRQF